jgi:hypothetical protein
MLAVLAELVLDVQVERAVKPQDCLRVVRAELAVEQVVQAQVVVEVKPAIFYP